MAFRLPLLLVFFLFIAQAENPDISVIFNKHTRVPGKQLKPGAYTFRILGQLSDRLLLEMSDQRRHQAVATFIGIPDPGLPRKADSPAIFWNVGGKPVLRGIWISNPPMAVELVFEKEEAAKLAKRVHQPVPAIDPASEGLKPLPAMSEADRKMVTLWLLSAVSVTPGGEQVGIQAAKYVPPTSPAPTASDTVARQHVEQSESFNSRAQQTVARNKTERMPKTAGEWAGALLTGFVCLTAGFGLLAASRRFNA